MQKMNGLFALSSLLFAGAAMAKVDILKSSGQTRYQFQVEGVERVIENGQTRVKLQGLENYTGVHYELGTPEVPVIRFNVMADSREDIVITKMKAAGITKSLDGDLVVSSESAPKIRGAQRTYYKNLNADKNEMLPKRYVSVKEIGSYKGQKRFQVTLYPFKYNSVTNEYSLQKNHSVSVKEPMQEKGMLKQKAFAFIVGAEYKENATLKRYMDYKRSLGFFVDKVVFGEDVHSDIEIRNHLKSLLATESIDLQYALIIGDHDDVPSHSARHISGVTDHFYRAIDTENYLTDINSPDIGLGRITVNTNFELNTVLKKLTKYSRGEFRDSSWLKKAAFLATDDRHVVAEGTHNYVIDNYTQSRGFLGIFPNARQLGGDRVYAITHRAGHTEVMQTAQAGRSIINYSGHGAITYWDAPRMNQADVKALEHRDARPFVISNACITGKFHSFESFGETWLKAANGAIMFWGSMDNTYWDEDDILEKRMYDGIFLEGKRTFAEITQYALAEHWRHYGGSGRSAYYWETYVTFGDPSIALRTKFE